MNVVKKMAVLCLPFVLAACGTVPVQRPAPVDETNQPVSQPSEPLPPVQQSKPKKRPQSKPAQIDHAAQAPAAVVALLARAEQQEGAGDVRAATASLERAIRIAPRYPESYYRLGELRYKEGRYDQARSLGQKAISLGADWWLRLLAESLVERASAH